MIRKRGKKYQAIVYIGIHNGKRQYKSRTFNSLKEALDFENRARLLVSDSISVHDLSQLWLSSLNVRESTKRNYEMVLRLHILNMIGQIKVKNVTTIIIQSMLNEIPPSRTKLYVYQTLSAMFSYAEKVGVVMANPVRVLTRPAYNRRQPKFLTEEELLKFLQVANLDWYREFWYLACTTGMRRGELCGLQWPDIDLEMSRIYVNRQIVKIGGKTSIAEPKTQSSRRTVPILPSIAAMLRERKRFNEWVFTNAEGTGYVDPGYIAGDYFKRLWAKTGIEKSIRFHDLRHTAASIWLKNNVHPKIVQVLLGHSTISITLDTYSHLLPNIYGPAIESMGRIITGKKNKTV